jgi:hypothetical protein
MIITADIENCRLLLLVPPSTGRAGSSAGPASARTTRRLLTSPNGALPATSGMYLVTEINGDWVRDRARRAPALVHAPAGRHRPTRSRSTRAGIHDHYFIRGAGGQFTAASYGGFAASTTRRWHCPCPTATSSSTTTTTTASS